MNRSSLVRFDLVLLVLFILYFSGKISSSSSSNKNPEGLIGEVGAGIGIGVGGGIIDIALPPILSPVIGGVEQLIFQDLRLAIVYPIIQNFKNIIVGDPLGITKTWIGSDICNNYRGFYCESPPDNKSALALASIDFNGFQLTAPSIDGFIDKLPDLAIFHANSNNFSGLISSNIANLPYLYEFDISNNQFSGPFPNAILAMPSLSFLDIRFNSFTGAIPPQLFVKDDLYAVFLNNNNFMQRLPDNGIIGSSDILYLTLANNKFFGPIPRDISKSLFSLNEILLLNNLLSGCIPYELGFLKQAVVLDAGENRLTGPLPYSLGCLERVEILNFAGNQLYGLVPEVICALENLVNLSLSNNYFTTIGPICFHLIKKGVLDLKNNCIPGLPFQRSVNDCAGFFSRSRRCPFKGTYTYIP